MTSELRLPFVEEVPLPDGAGPSPPPSIRPETSFSKRQPAPARPACWWSATSTCCAPASSPITFSPITFTRKAAAEMRQRIIDRLKEASRTVGDRRGAVARSEDASRRHRHLDDRRVLPVAAARSFRSRPTSIRASSLADDTEMPRLIGESLDQALRICRRIAGEDDDVALVFAQLGERRLRSRHRGARSIGVWSRRMLCADSCSAVRSDLTAAVGVRSAARPR